jgi:DNA-binding MarR family transcriptional regulator
MAAERKKSLTQRLIQASRACRGRSGAYLARFDLHAGQETVLQALDADDGMSMSALAAKLGVQPPTVTKMIARLAAQGYVARKSSNGDARQAHVFLTAQGRAVTETLVEVIDKVEAEALAGLDDKDRKRLKKMLRQIEKNLSGLGAPDVKPKRRTVRRKAVHNPVEAL